ncbi:MAG: sulfatase-like hydrolase/transferase [Rhodobacter sp.]|nr:sulfatase-like hydrolase/transferase [Rhodobacter sp.]
MKRPNVLLIMTDQQRADHLGCMGNSILRTPNIDRIARRGVRFEDCHVVNPICQVNRASIMTGRYPSSHRVRCNGIPLSQDARTYADVLRDAGYRTVMIGKSHLQNITGLPPVIDPPGKGPYERRDGRLVEGEERHLDGPEYDAESTPLWQDDPDRGMPAPYYGFDVAEVCTMHADQVSGAYERWLLDRCNDPDSLRGPVNALDKGTITTPRAWRTRMPEELYPTTYVAERTIAHIDRMTADGDDRPFLIKCSFPDPHAPFTPPGRYWSMYDPDAMPVSESFGKGTSPVIEHMRKTLADGTDKRNGELPFAVTEREARESLALTYGMIAMIDDAVGRILDRLEELGVMDNTIVVFMSDHGDEMGDHGIMQKGPLHYRGSTRVPFLWSDPAYPSRAGASVPGLASSIDFAQTLLQRLDLAEPYGMQGVSLLPLIDGTEAEVRDHIYMEDDRERIYLGFTEPQRLRTVLTHDHRLTVYDPLPWTEMFDLTQDPGENTNLWDDPGQAALRSRMLELMVHAAIRSGERLPFLTGAA